MVSEQRTQQVACHGMQHACNDTAIGKAFATPVRAIAINDPAKCLQTVAGGLIDNLE